MTRSSGTTGGRRLGSHGRACGCVIGLTARAVGDARHNPRRPPGPTEHPPNQCGSATTRQGERLARAVRLEERSHSRSLRVAVPARRPRPVLLEPFRDGLDRVPLVCVRREERVRLRTSFAPRAGAPIATISQTTERPLSRTFRSGRTWDRISPAVTTYSNRTGPKPNLPPPVKHCATSCDLMFASNLTRSLTPQWTNKTRPAPGKSNHASVQKP